MIGSIALLYTFLATPSVAVDVRAPRIEIPDVRVEAPPFAAPDAMTAEDDQDEEDEDEHQAERDARRSQRERLRERREEMRGRDDFDPAFSGPPTARAKGKNGSATLPVKGPVTFRLRVQAGEAEVGIRVGGHSDKLPLTPLGRGSRWCRPRAR